MGRFAINPAVLATLLISTAIAFVAPFDVVFAAVTFGSPGLRMALIAAVVLAGTFCAGKVGLRLDGHGARWPVFAGLGGAIAVALYVAVIDVVLFRSTLSASYVASLHTPLNIRLSYFMLRAFNENVIYRLFVFSSLLYLLSLSNGSRNLTPAWIASAMVVAQVINIGLNVVIPSPDPITATSIFYDLLRYVSPGVLWAWLFWRFGFITAEVASVGCHIFLQPMFSYLV